jgi:hypothetical protein
MVGVEDLHYWFLEGPGWQLWFKPTSNQVF